MAARSEVRTAARREEGTAVWREEGTAAGTAVQRKAGDGGTDGGVEG